MHIEKTGATIAAPDVDTWRDNMRSQWGGVPTLHTEANIVVVDAGPDIVISESTWTAVMPRKVGGQLDVPTITAFGTHADVLEAVKSANGAIEWRFRSRVIKHLHG